jgi:hypothetical protein
LRRVIPLGEKQGLHNELLTPLPANSSVDGPIKCRERLGGMLSYYYREAA